MIIAKIFSYQIVSIIERFFAYVGADRSIVYTVVGRFWAFLSGVATLAFIVQFLSPVQQGYYYTFGSILGIQIFLDLGLSYVVMQFTSHEVAQLYLNADGTFDGDTRAKSRIASLLRYSMSWYSVVAILAILILIPAGFLVFTSNPQGESVPWLIPWIWLVPVAIVGTLGLNPLLAIMEGCGFVADIALLRFSQALIGSLVLWFTLWHGYALLSIAFFETSKLIVGCSWLFWRYKRTLFDLVSTPINSTSFNWWKEVWPLQWKIALSAVSGYFVYQLFVPVLFASHQPVLAGQMGISLSVSMTILSVSMAWISTKAAPFGSLIAKREYAELDRVFFFSFQRSLILLVLNCLLFWGTIYYLNVIDHHVSQRFLSPLPLGLLLSAVVINHVVFAEAVYLRAHKQEPLLVTSILMGTSMMFTTYFLGRSYGVIGMMAGYFVVMLFFGLVASTWIFFRKRRLWHSINIV